MTPSIWGLSLWASGVAIFEMGNAKGGKILANMGGRIGGGLHMLSLRCVLFFNLLKYGTFYEFACHPYIGAMPVFSVSFQF